MSHDHRVFLKLRELPTIGGEPARPKWEVRCVTDRGQDVLKAEHIYHNKGKTKIVRFAK